MNDEKYPYQDVLEHIVKGLVDHPEEVKIERRLDEMGVLLTLKVHKDDMGAVVGRQGTTARAIRTLVRIIGMKNQARVNLKIEEPDGGRGPASPREPRDSSLDNLQL
ncbi:MAG: KH domain-containing protein [Candidatus Yanofskybacteria bacterium]|nr:KH domain-containing protein [Candidatus Yanofskybacteria bacterium]